MWCLGDEGGFARAANHGGYAQGVDGAWVEPGQSLGNRARGTLGQQRPTVSRQSPTIGTWLERVRLCQAAHQFFHEEWVAVAAIAEHSGQVGRDRRLQHRRGQRRALLRFERMQLDNVQPPTTVELSQRRRECWVFVELVVSAGAEHQQRAVCRRPRT